MEKKATVNLFSYINEPEILHVLFVMKNKTSTDCCMKLNKHCIDEVL